MDASFILNQRLLNQQLTLKDYQKPEDLVNWMVAMQAQEFAMAKWAIGLRLQGSTESQIDEALNQGLILRTHLMRPTWHFVTPMDIRWLLKLTAPRINALNASMYKKLELDNSQFKRCNKVLEKTLQGGKFLTREELNTALKKNKIIANGLRLVYFMMRAETEGLICSGPRRGKQFTYCLLEERVNPAPELSKPESLQLLAQRYFASRGPATIRDFAVWSGLTMPDTREAVASLPGGFEKFTWNEQEYIFKPGDRTALTGSTGSFLMPIYDEYGMAYKDRSHLFNKKLNPVGPTIFNNLIVINGAAAGGWIRKFEGKKLILELHPFTKLNQANQAKLEKAVKLFRKFYGV